MARRVEKWSTYEAAEARSNSAKSAGYGERPQRTITTAIDGMANPPGTLQAEMYRDGLRYGDPDMPRYCTGRADGAAPHLPGTGAGECQLKVGRQRR